MSAPSLADALEAEAEAIAGGLRGRGPHEQSVVRLLSTAVEAMLKLARIGFTEDAIAERLKRVERIDLSDARKAVDEIALSKSRQDP